MELHPPGQWILQWLPHMDWETPGLICLPSLEYIWELEREFDAFHSAEIQKYYASKKAANKKSIADDIQGGGHRAFASVRDAPAPPLTSVTKIARYQMRQVEMDQGRP